MALRQQTGMTRKVDNLGRVIIPFDIRQGMGIVPKETAMEVFVEIDENTKQIEAIVFSKYHRGCSFCGGFDSLKEYFSKQVCQPCRNAMSEV